MLDKVRIISLGGNDEHGKNLIAVEINDDIFVVECGTKFPDRTMHGIDYIVPRFDYLIENKDRVRGYFLSRGHDIVLGGLPYIYKRVPAPVYCTSVTKIFLESFMAHNHIKIDIDYHLISASDEVKVVDRKIRFFETSTNMADSCAIAISTDGGNIIIATAFVVDNNADSGYTSNSKMFNAIAQEKTLVCMFDSCYAERSGYTSPKYRLTPFVEQTFKDAQGRIFIAMENSDIYNIEKILYLAKKTKRKIIAFDDSMAEVFRNVSMAHKVDITKDDIASLEEVMRLRPQNVCVIMTGFGARLFHKIQLFASGKYSDKRLRLNSTDTFIMGVPNNISAETIFTDTIDELYHTDCHIIYFKKWEFVKMHPSEEDIKHFLVTFRPKYYIPVNGTFKELLANARTALEMNIGLNHTNVFVLDNGMVLEINDNGAHISQEKILAGDLLVDGRDLGNQDSQIVAERSTLSDDGVVILGIGVDLASRKVVAGPDVQTRGLVFVKESEALLKEITKLFVAIVEAELAKEDCSISRMETSIKDQIFKDIRRHTLKSPMIIPIIAKIDK